MRHWLAVVCKHRTDWDVEIALWQAIYCNRVMGLTWCEPIWSADLLNWGCFCRRARHVFWRVTLMSADGCFCVVPVLPHCGTACIHDVHVPEPNVCPANTSNWPQRRHGDVMPTQTIKIWHTQSRRRGRGWVFSGEGGMVEWEPRNFTESSEPIRPSENKDRVTGPISWVVLTWLVAARTGTVKNPVKQQP